MGRWGAIVLISFALVSGLTLIYSCDGGGGGHESRLVFNADDGGGRELWILEKSGSLEKIDIDATSGASPGPFGKYKGKLYFRARDTSHGDELWVYDGVNAPSMVANINTDDTTEFGSWPGEEYDSRTNDMVEYEGRFYFSASTSTERRLWVYDGAGSPSVASTAFSYPRFITRYDDRLFFSAYDSTDDLELWSFDGANAAVAASINSSGGSNPSYLVEYSGRLYFSANDGTNGQELWVYDADTENAWMVTDIRTGVDPSAPGYFTVFNGILYFSATDNTNNYELWAYDAGTDSAYLVTDLYPGNSSYPNGFTIFNGQLYFSAGDGSTQTLWAYNGVDAPAKVAGAGTVYLNAYNNSAVFDGELYFQNYSTSYGYEPWKYDGVSAPSMLADINSSGDSYPWNFFVY